MNQISNQFLSIEQIRDQYLNQSQNAKSAYVSDVAFEDVLRQKQNEAVMESSELKFSKHAANRLNDRNILLTDSQSVRLENGVKQASEKGITESLVLIDSLAFIVNIPNKTVVTALDQTETNSNIFTNIDGAVII
ncbi:MAG: flagellar protein [Lachnospiraceae bacterium]|nr:flagellar protein [Lachnospiraceae bacterium]MBO5097359.1 flagellar protein [Agathobacter sp.]